MGKTADPGYRLENFGQTKVLPDGTKIERTVQAFGPRLWRCVETIYRTDGTVVAHERGFASSPATRDKWVAEGFAP